VLFDRRQTILASILFALVAFFVYKAVRPPQTPLPPVTKIVSVEYTEKFHAQPRRISGLIHPVEYEIEDVAYNLGSIWILEHQVHDNMLFTLGQTFNPQAPTAWLTRRSLTDADDENKKTLDYLYWNIVVAAGRIFLVSPNSPPREVVESDGQIKLIEVNQHSDLLSASPELIIIPAEWYFLIVDGESVHWIAIEDYANTGGRHLGRRYVFPSGIYVDLSGKLDRSGLSDGSAIVNGDSVGDGSYFVADDQGGLSFVPFDATQEILKISVPSNGFDATRRLSVLNLSTSIILIQGGGQFLQFGDPIRLPTPGLMQIPLDVGLRQFEDVSKNSFLAWNSEKVWLGCIGVDFVPEASVQAP
jgi:hypothetical protein